MERQFPGGKVLRLLVGDITRVPTDAMVNAANSALIAGGGVDGAIHRAGGPVIQQELNVIRAQAGGCPTGSAVATGAGALPARWVFHAVGPVYRDGRHQEAGLLASCYTTCLQMAEERGAATISFPSISTGAYGYPLEQAARVTLEAIIRRLKQPEGQVREVILVLFDRRAYDVYARLLAACPPDPLE
jgi:O-acetyl-ADP-ribose deacetylase (regulator of RNase III)